MKTMIAVPCMDNVPIQFATSLARLNKPENTVLSCLTGSLVYESRNKLAKQAISMGADYILWLDSDMTFEPNTLVKMLEHLKDKDIVSGLYFRRAAPFSPVIFKSSTDGEDKVEWEDYNDYPDGLFEIAGCGFGCVAMKTSVLYSMALEYQNWFEPFKFQGEDLSFCYRARQMGYKIWCDPKITLGHMAHLEVNENIWLSTKGA